MNKIGFNVLAWSAGMSDDLFPIIEQLKEIGYDGVEYFIGAPDEDAYKRVGNRSRELGLGVTAVTVVSPDTNPVSESATVRAQALDQLKWVIDRAYDLNAEVLCGPFHSAHAHFVARPASVDEFARAAEVLRAAGDYAAQANLILAPEALNRFECYLCNTMEHLANLVQLTNHPNVRAMFDTHHANIEEKNTNRPFVP